MTIASLFDYRRIQRNTDPDRTSQTEGQGIVLLSDAHAQLLSSVSSLILETDYGFNVKE
jgi:hypothetical protein